MGKFFTHLTDHHREFIQRQHLFFVATAPLSDQGRINLSPKGLNSFRIFSDQQVGYADLVGSGNETSAHLLENARITFMFCAFDGSPLILRLYGTGRVILPSAPDWENYAPQFALFPGTRQLIVADIDKVQTSCGFGVPYFDFVGDRDMHQKWSTSKGPEGLEAYVQEKNTESLDGLPTHWGQRLGTAKK